MAYLDDSGNELAPQAAPQKVYLDNEGAPRAASEGMTLSQIQMLRAHGINPSAAPETIEAGEESPILGAAAGQNVGGMRMLPSGQTEQQGALELAGQLPRMATGALAAGVPALGAAAGSMINSAASGALGVPAARPWYESLWNSGRDAWKQGYEGRGEGFMGVVTDPMNVVAMLAPPLAETRIVGQLANAASEAMRASRIPLSAKVASMGVPLAARATEGFGYGAAPGFIRGDLSGSEVGKAGLIGAAINATVPALASSYAVGHFPGIERLEDYSHGFSGGQKTSMTNIKLDNQDVLDLIDASWRPSREGLFSAAAGKKRAAGTRFETAIESVAPEHRAVSLDQIAAIPNAVKRDIEEKSYLGLIPGESTVLARQARQHERALLRDIENIKINRAKNLSDFLPQNQWAAEKLKSYDAPTSALFADSDIPYANLRELQALRKQRQAHYGPGSTETAKKQLDEAYSDAINEIIMQAPGYEKALGNASGEFAKAIQMGRLLNYNQIGAKNRYFLPVAARKLGTPGGLSGLPFAAFRNLMPAHLAEESDSTK